MFHSKNRTTC